MTMTTDDRIAEVTVPQLSTAEIFNGLLVFTTKRRFPEQAVYVLFRRIVEKHPEMSSRFGLMGRRGHYSSGILRQWLNMFAMGNAISMVTAADPQMIETIDACEPCISFLIKRHILPASPTEKLLRELAREFDTIVNNDEYPPTL